MVFSFRFSVEKLVNANGPSERGEDPFLECALRTISPTENGKRKTEN